VPRPLNGLRRPPLRVWLWTAATLALVVVAALLWRGSDAAATESTTAQPAGVPTGTPAGAVSEAWSAAGGPLPERVVESGRVLVGSEHGVRALDPLTGREAWHYTRSNAVMCGLTATDGVAVAVFRTEDRCDEVVALTVATGVRAWTRNVNFRGDAALDSTDRIVLATSPTGIVTLDPTGDNIRWRYSPPQGCRLLGADAGSAGVAVLQRCAGAPAAQLRLFDGFEGSPHWTRDLPAPEGGSVRLIGAGDLLGVVVGDEFQALAAGNGSVVHTLPVPDGAAGTVAMRTFDAVALVRVGGTLSALDTDSGAVLWDAPATGLPAEPTLVKDDRSAAALLVPTEDGFVHRDPVTGAELGRSEVSGLPAGGVAFGVGPAVVYRFPDRVLGYR
jgi:outer membrane protein assembly factor BamB